jgi:hypothetical protein
MLPLWNDLAAAAVENWSPRIAGEWRMLAALAINGETPRLLNGRAGAPIPPVGAAVPRIRRDARATAAPDVGLPIPSRIIVALPLPCFAPLEIDRGFVLVLLKDQPRGASASFRGATKMFVALKRSLKCTHKSYRVYCKNEKVHNYLYLIDPYNIDNRRSFETWVLRSSTMDDHLST